MPQTPEPLVTIALKLGASPVVMLTHRRVLDYLVPRFDEVPDDLFADMLIGITDLPDAVVVAAARKTPHAFGSLADRAVRSSALRRPLALGRLRAGLPIGPDAAEQNVGLVLPSALRSQFHLDVALAQDVLCISEHGGLYAIVAARYLDEYRAIYEVARRMPDDEAAQVVAAIEASIRRGSNGHTGTDSNHSS